MSDEPSAGPDAGLARVIYRSHSLLPQSVGAAHVGVTEILIAARRNNGKTGVTGVLLFDGVHFMQALEGERGEVEHVYERIAQDLRHEDIELLECKPITERGYQAFPMAYGGGPADERDDLRRLLDLLTVRTGAEEDDRLPLA
jgi:hypothetical protein